MVSGVEKALLALLLVVLMMGMGSTVDRAGVEGVVKRPRGVLIGLASQFGWMPLLAFLLAKVTQLGPEMALGLLVVGSTPGGTTSNLYAYLSKADVPLSIAMTAVSTVVAVVAMPAVLWLYGSGLTSDGFVLPLKDIATTLVLVLVPTAIGMGIRARSVAAAAIVEKVGTGAGVLVLAMLVGSALLNHWQTFLLIPAGGYVAAASLGLAGMGLGLGMSKLAGLDGAQARSVSLETGIQNSPLAFAVILATFPEEMQEQMLWIPLLYALFVLLNAAVVTVGFRWFDSRAQA